MRKSHTTKVKDLIRDNMRTTNFNNSYSKTLSLLRSIDMLKKGKIFVEYSLLLFFGLYQQIKDKFVLCIFWHYQYANLSDHM